MTSRAIRQQRHPVHPSHEVTTATLRLVQSLASLASVQPESRRAAHLVRPAEELARQIQRAVGGGR